MGRNTMTVLQKRNIVSASIKVWIAVNELSEVLTGSGQSTKETDRVSKLWSMASRNVSYWIDRHVVEMSYQQNRCLSLFLDDMWKTTQKTHIKPIVEEAQDGTS